MLDGFLAIAGHGRLDSFFVKLKRRLGHAREGRVDCAGLLRRSFHPGLKLDVESDCLARPAGSINDVNRLVRQLVFSPRVNVKNRCRRQLGR